MRVRIVIRYEEREIQLKAEKGSNLLQLLQAGGIPISAVCAGTGNCGKCRIRVNKGRGKISTAELGLLTGEEVKKGYRLACRMVVEDDMEIEVPGEEGLQILTGVLDMNIEFNPRPEFDGLYGDKEGKGRGKAFGLAVDLGTTTVAVYLLDLLTGEEVAVASFANPQRKYGADVLRRIDYARRGEKELRELQDILIRQLNFTIEELAVKNKITVNDIYSLSLAANTVMTHLFTGTDPSGLARPPFRPVFIAPQELSPAELDIKINPRGRIQILPIVSAFIGSDIIAGLLVTDFNREEWSLLIDLGTNGEIVLGNRYKLLACSTAAGPAFEGASITYGVPGVPGAIASFRIGGDRQIDYKTINEQAPVGICGSGLVDIIAELLEHGIISRTGLIREDTGPDIFKIRDYKNMRAIEIIPEKYTAIDGPILLTQKDIREVQLAKGAIAAGISILMKEAGIGFDALANIYLAGGFGSFIDPHNACKISLLPGEMEKRVRKIGNAAGLGARGYLLDKGKREEAGLLAEKIEYIELSLREDFQAEFIQALDF